MRVRITDLRLGFALTLGLAIGLHNRIRVRVTKMVRVRMISDTFQTDLAAAKNK